MVPLEDALKRLEVAAQRLNEISDDLNTDIVLLEERLTQISVGVALRLGLHMDEQSGEDPADGRWVTTWDDLGYAKVGGAWRVVLYEVSKDDQHEAEILRRPVPLTDAPRLSRCRAIPHFEALVMALVERCESLTTSVATARDAKSSS